MAPEPAPYCLVGHVRPHDPEAYLAYVRDTYLPALRAMPGFRSLRVLRWHTGDWDFLGISTWATRADAEAYLGSSAGAAAGAPGDLATVIAYAGADVEVDGDGGP